MSTKKSKFKKRCESRRVRDIEKSDSTFENIDERDEDYLYCDIIPKKTSSEENNISSSISTENVKNKKKGKKKKKIIDKNQEDMDNALIQLEKKNKEKMLKGELAEIMEEIEKENKDFKKNVFFSNFHDLHNHLGIFDEGIDNSVITENYCGLKNPSNSPYGLIDKYTEKANNLKNQQKMK